MPTIRAIGTAAELPWYLALLARAHADVGQTAGGFDALAEALALVASTNERFYEAEIYRLKYEPRLKHCGSNTVAEAESCFRQALDICRVQSAKLWELRAVTSLACLWADQGRRDLQPAGGGRNLRCECQRSGMPAVSGVRHSARSVTAAAIISIRAGTISSPVRWISQVATSGVSPPNSPTLKL